MAGSAFSWLSRDQLGEVLGFSPPDPATHARVVPPAVSWVSLLTELPLVDRIDTRQIALSGRDAPLPIDGLAFLKTDNPVKAMRVIDTDYSTETYTESITLSFVGDKEDHLEGRKSSKMGQYRGESCDHVI